MKLLLFFVSVYSFGILSARNLIAIDQSGKFLASSLGDKEIIIWDIKKGNHFFSFDPDCDMITDLVLYSDINNESEVSVILSCSDGYIISKARGTKKQKQKYPPVMEDITFGPINCSLGGKLYCFGDKNNCIIDIKTRDFNNYFDSNFDTVPLISELSQVGKYIIAGYPDGWVRVWSFGLDKTNIPYTKLKSKRQLSSSIISDLAISATGTVAAVLNQTGSLYLYDYGKNKVIKEQKIITNGNAKSVAFTQNGGDVLTGHSNGMINYWDLKFSSIKFLDSSRREIHSGVITDMITHPRLESIVISLGDDNYIRFTEYNNYKILGTIYKDSSGWVVYNKRGDYTGNRAVPEFFQKKTRIANPFQGMF